MRFFSRVGVGLFAFLLAAACSVSQEDAGRAEREISDAPIEVRVSAVELYEDYESNEVAANLKYDGKVLAVTGIVEEVSGGDDSAYYVDLATGDFALTNVRCYFGPGHLDELTSIGKGDQVVLRGKGDEGEDRNPFTIDVVGCSILER